jgi:hypothetical protein
VRRIHHDQFRSVPLAFVRQHGPDDPRRDHEQRPVLVRFFLTKVPGASTVPLPVLVISLTFRSSMTAPPWFLTIIVVAFCAASLLRRACLACNLATLRFAFFSVHGLVTDSRNCQSEKQTWQSEALGPHVGATQ